MQRCIELALLGLGRTNPNPMVGAVIVENGEIIGEGWHRKAGEPHAEVNAIESVSDKSRLKNATIYVSLEPCAHYGKTPPCALRILEEGISKVVVGTRDPHKAVSGKGIDMMREKGIEVMVGILEKECQDLNKAFFTFHKENRPYVVLKWAQSTEGYIAPLPSMRVENEPAWITGSKTKQLVHRMRAQADAILVGGKTVVTDNPSLTTRLWDGKDPLRIVWTDRPIDQRNDVMSDGGKTWVIGPNASEYGYKLPIESWDVHSTSELLFELFEKGVMSLMVEGGPQTLEKFIANDLWDEAYVLTGKRSFNNGLPAPKLTNANFKEMYVVDDDIWLRFEHL